MTDSTFTLSMYLLALLGELFSIHTFVHTHTLSSTNYSASVTSFQVIALEYSVEMTYPLPEGTSAGLLNLFGLVSTHTHLTSNSDTLSLSLSIQTISVILIAGVGKLHDKKMYIGAWIITALTIVGGFLVGKLCFYSHTNTVAFNNTFCIAFHNKTQPLMQSHCNHL